VVVAGGLGVVPCSGILGPAVIGLLDSSIGVFGVEGLLESSIGVLAVVVVIVAAVVVVVVVAAVVVLIGPGFLVNSTLDSVPSAPPKVSPHSCEGVLRPWFSSQTFSHPFLCCSTLPRMDCIEAAEKHCSNTSMSAA